MSRNCESARTKILDYSPGLFVNREEAIDLVVGKVRNISAGKPERKRVIVFWGYRGAGKTWLLRHLAETVLPEIPGVCAVYVNLQDFKDKPAEDAVRDIIGKILEALQRAQRQKPNVSFLYEPTPLPLHRAAHFLTQALGNTNLVLVLLVDCVYEAAPELLDLLEKHVLGPLVVNPRVVIVMAGRGQGYAWETATLRIQAEDCELKPFDK
ncbi:MAG: AAA family ATPase, partial [Anaerolineae bacterium]